MYSKVKFLEIWSLDINKLLPACFPLFIVSLKVFARKTLKNLVEIAWIAGIVSNCFPFRFFLIWGNKTKQTNKKIAGSEVGAVGNSSIASLNKPKLWRYVREQIVRVISPNNSGVWTNKPNLILQTLEQSSVKLT